jgi:hypothetical protein
MPARGVAPRTAGGIGKYDDRKLEALRFVKRHQAHALGSFLDDGRFIRLAAFGIHVQFVDEGPER